MKRIIEINGKHYKRIDEILNEKVDDDKIIKYRDKEGESQEMTAGAAKKQPDDHPAKVAYNLYNKKASAGGADSEKKEKPEVNIFDKPEDDDKPKAKATEKPGGASHIESSGGNNVLLAKGTADHIARHNKPGEGSVFSDDVSMDDIQNAISKIPEEFYENGGGIHTTTVPNAGYNLVQKSSDIEKLWLKNKLDTIGKRMNLL